MIAAAVANDAHAVGANVSPKPHHLLQYAQMASAYAAGNGLRFVFLSVVIAVIFANVLRSSAVTLNTVFGASCIYLLMGLAWATSHNPAAA